ncbi:unnamed protein product [Bursaphelenchus xylophilus]|uniref:(pine wood nematode) hypothetical protein n=1 Tax=Bursaphelenchus xylophilus TaxID=6326 RepID=A0A1I7STD4_BURXY|nr:unnamed protein product [Bursaphelenchus xylophilus]CAG9108542.1 unnamed protein product [Bursaphelenchus xylophilus]
MSNVESNGTSNSEKLKIAARGLENAIDGGKIDYEACREVVEALKNCSDVPEPILKGLAFVVASNVVNCKTIVNDSASRILFALLKKDFVKGLEFFLKSYSKVQPSIPVDKTCVYGKKDYIVVRWIIRALLEAPKSVQLADDILFLAFVTVSTITYRLPQTLHKKVFVSVRKCLDKYPVGHILTLLESKLSSETDNWKIFTASCLLVSASTASDRIQTEEVRKVAKFWLKSFSAVFLQAKVYPGDDLYLFGDGYESFSILNYSEYGPDLQGSLRRLFLRTSEVAVPLLKIILSNTFPVNQEFSSFVGELLTDVASSINDKMHDDTAFVMSKVWIHMDPKIRTQAFEKFFGKQSKAKGRLEYMIAIKEELNLKLEKNKNAEEFVKYLGEYLEKEIPTCKADNVVQVYMQVLQACVGYSDDLREKAVTISTKLVKSPLPNGQSAALGAAVLTDVGVSDDVIFPIITDAVGKTFTSPAVSADFVFNISLLLFSKFENDKKYEDLFIKVLEHDVYAKERFLHHLSEFNLCKGNMFAEQFFRCITKLTSVKLPERSPLLSFVYILLHWKDRSCRRTDKTQLLSEVPLKKLSWALELLTARLNDFSLLETTTKIFDVYFPNNNWNMSDVFINSAFYNFFASVESYLKRETNDEIKTELVYQLVLYLNNNSHRNEKVVTALAGHAARDGELKNVLFGSLGSKLDLLLQYPDLKCRQRAVEWLVGIESENSLFRDFVWTSCIEFCKKLDIKKLNEVTEMEAAIFFTAEGTLHNTRVIDENSDAGLDTRQNLRKENKAYKFKDQLAEIELRKELAERNKKEGKLNDRQKQAIQKELLKETTLRKELIPFFEGFRDLADLLQSAVRADPNGALKNYYLYHDALVPVLKSYLVKDLAFECLTTYANVFFGHTTDFLKERALSAVLRATNSVTSIKEWEWESLLDQISQMTSSMSMLCMMNNFLEDENAIDALEQLQEEENNEEFFNEGLTLGKLAFVLPVFERVYKDEKIDDRLRREVTGFLKSAFSIDFLTADERSWAPLNILNKLLLDVLTDVKTRDYFPDVFNLLKDALKELDENSKDSAETAKFVSALIGHLRNTNEYVREHVALLLVVGQNILMLNFIKKDDFPQIVPLLIASKETHPATSEVMQFLCQGLEIKTEQKYHDCLMEELKYPHDFWQQGAAECLKGLFSSDTIKKCHTLYDELLKIVPAVHDNVGRVIYPERDPWESRRGLACLLKHVADDECYDTKLFDEFFTFLVPKGISDPNEIVRKMMYESAAAIISHNGANKVDFVLPLLERLLTGVPDTQEGDILRNGLICLMGTLARYLEPCSPKMKAIFRKLIEALATPSRQVQESVALCLPPLAKPMGDEAVEELSKMMRHLPQTKNFAERCGFAYGIAGLTRGRGLVTLRDIKFIEYISEMFEAKESNIRESACILFMTMSFVHGKAFDPYISKILKYLISAFGDSSESVRLAAKEAGGMMMSTVTPAGVKIFLPQILAGLEEEAWRTKCASADFLGSISNCAPRQLSESLPKVVPRLATLMTDSHAKVRASGVFALKQIATVITNPEILAISSHMIAAFVEPAKETTRALQTIVNTKFVHFIDPPSLALMMPILKRALLDREPEGRKMAANVVTNVFSIADEKDIAPYMEMLIPNLKHSLLDPSPEVRSAAAQAIGAVVRHNTTGLFTSYTTDLLPWLKEHMMSRSSMVDRLGAAQGLAEVIPAFKNGVETIMDHAITFTEDVNNEASMRDGYIRLFTYLPSTMGEKFVPYIERVIPSILSALSDETEYLRQSALHAGQILIKTYCSQAKQLLLPSLLEGVLNENWRIRHAAVTLIGDFLFNISGISSKMTSDTATEDDTFGMESVNKTIVKYVGQKSRDKIIVSLYIARFDCAVQVRQAASHVWKLVVPNTPRTVKESLSSLYDLIVYCLGTSTEDRRIMGLECLSEVVRKMGDRIMEILMGEVRKSFESTDEVNRKGAAEALTIILNCANSEAIEEHSKTFINIFRICLLDADGDVRQSGADAFAAYYNKAGITAMEEIVEPLFKEYAANQSEGVLDGIVAILSANRKGRVLTVPSLINRLLNFPRRAHVLARLTEVAADTIERSLIEVLTKLLKEPDDENPTVFFNDCAKLVKCARSVFSITAISKFLTQHASEGNELAAKLLGELIKNTDVDYLDEVLTVFVEGIMTLYVSPNKAINVVGAATLTSLVNTLEPRDVLEIPNDLTIFLNAAQKEGKPLEFHGLSQPGGWKPFIDIIGIASRAGSLEQRDKAVRVVADFMEVASAEALRPVAPLAVGTLLRLLADHCPPVLKLNSIRMVEILVEKVSQLMRNFGPQLLGFLLRIIQETVEESSNEIEHLRSVTAGAIAKILKNHPRQEVALIDTFTTMTNVDSNIQPCILEAITQAVSSTGPSVSDAVVRLIDEYVAEYLRKGDDNENIDPVFIKNLAGLYAAVKKVKSEESDILNGTGGSDVEGQFWSDARKYLKG